MPLDSLLQTLPHSIGVFAVSALVIAVAGVSISGIADRLADRTGWGEAIVGILFLALATSLPDFAATITAAADGHAQLAVSNMMGSMALNIVFLGVGDLLYRKANLEHAAASTANLLQTALLIALLAITLLAILGPEISAWSIHPVSLILPVVYLFGIGLVRRSQLAPMWTPRPTAETVVDRPDTNKRGERSLTFLWLSFAGLSLMLALSGWVLMTAAESIMTHAALSETLVGTLLTAASTSTPELVTTVAAIRRGALTLAVGGLIGTNCFNVTAIAAADFAYRGGSIYHAVAEDQIRWGLLTILMCAVLLLGFVHREKYGLGRIGFESVLILMLYAGSVVLLLIGI